MSTSTTPRLVYNPQHRTHTILHPLVSYNNTLIERQSSPPPPNLLRATVIICSNPTLSRSVCETRFELGWPSTGFNQSSTLGSMWEEQIPPIHAPGTSLLSLALTIDLLRLSGASLLVPAGNAFVASTGPRCGDKGAETSQQARQATPDNIRELGVSTGQSLSLTSCTP